MSAWRVLVTRPAAQSGEFCTALEYHGMTCLCIPAIEIVGPPDWAPVDEAVAGLSSYDGVLFTSTNAVDAFLGRLGDASELAARPVWAVGLATAAALGRAGVEVQPLPPRFSAKDLAEHLPEVEGRRYLFPSALQPRPDLVSGIRARGGDVDVVPVYQTQPVAESGIALKGALEEGVDVVVFLSPSAAETVVQLLGGVPPGVASAALGPTTAASLRRLGWAPEFVPMQATVPALVEMLAEAAAAASS